MPMIERFVRPVSTLVLTGFLATTLYWPAAQAGMIGTDAVLEARQAAPERSRLRAALERDEVKSMLLARGVAPAQVQARIDNLTDAEVRSLAAHLDEMPAGGDALGLLAFVFIVLLITDILGFTDIFPFVKKPQGRR